MEVSNPDPILRWMDGPIDHDLVARLEDAAGALREGDLDVRWMVELLAVKLEAILPEQIHVDRHGLLRRRVRALTVSTPSRLFECRVPASGGLETSVAEVRRGIAGRAQAVPVRVWVEALQGALASELARSDAEREALGRLVP
jgi:hypothetical protein